MILYCVLIAVVALFSRFFALLIAVPFVTKLIFVTDGQEIETTSKSPALLQYLGIFTAICALLVIVNVLPLIQAFEIWISVGVSPLVFASALLKYKKYEPAFLLTMIPGLLFIGLKNLFFFPFIKLVAEESTQLFLSSIENVFSPEMLESMYPTFEKMQNMMIYGNASIWMTSIVFGVFFGALLFSRRNSLKWHFNSIKFPYYIQIGIAIGLILFIIKFRAFSYNVLFIVGLILLIQGYSVLYCYVEAILNRSKFLGIIMLIIPLFSYILLLVISVAGLLDNWLPLRKFAHHRGDT
ncbi:MAG: DUF2232 domain-containing protein [Candidatus Cloacimonetes bacterium]|nr:DUF2232 domain-containing protein [Candidatus Cloacimonadota bacterium]